MVERVVADLKRCIYCGALAYAPNSNRALADEHVIPFALNGDLILKHASCQICEKITGRFEAKLLRNTLLGSRVAMGMQSRKSTEVKKLPIFVGPNGREKIFLPINDYPHNLYLPIYGEPAIIAALGGRTISDEFGSFAHFFNNNAYRLSVERGITEWAAGSIDNRIFCRCLAKIAHAYAVGTRQNFIPILADVIRDPNLESRDILNFVGCGPAEEKTSNLHEIDNREIEIDGFTFCLSRIRLFANLGAPTYFVIVGIPFGRLLPPIPSNPGGVDAVQEFYRIRYFAN